MPIINKPVTPFEQPPYRGKITQGGGLRLADDWHRVIIHQQSDSKHLIAHDQSCFDEVVIEIHDSISKCGETEEIECRMESFALSPSQRMELAVYLLSTIEPWGK